MLYWLQNHSNFLHADHVNWLYLFPFFNWIKDIISKYFIILDYTAKLKFVDIVNNMNLFRIFVPYKSIYLHYQYFLSQFIQISSWLMYLNIEYNNRLSNYIFLFFCDNWFLLYWFFYWFVIKKIILFFNFLFNFDFCFYFFHCWFAIK